MKNIRKYFGLTLIALLFSVVFSACEDKNDIGSDNIGLGIKVFSPTKVVTGQPVTINGSGFGDVKEIVFPGNIVVTNFEKVSNEMIRVITPAGINIPAEGEHLIVRTADAEAVSPRVMTQGNTKPSGYSAEENAEVKGNSIVTIFGQDMEFVNKVVFKDKDDNDIILEPKDFYRIATTKIDIKIPGNIKEGEGSYSYYTYDGKSFNLPVYKYVKGGEEGHWEIKPVWLWKNETGDPVPGWGGTFRFANENAVSGEEIYAFTMDEWAIIKEEKVKVALDCNDGSNIRITTGWWTGAYGGAEHNCLDMVQEDENGNKFIELDIKGDGNLYDNIDAQHLLFTGDGYTVLGIYYEEKVWVEGEGGNEGHMERISYWKNETGEAVPGWGGKFRFGLDGNDGGNECIATFDADTWAVIKEGKVKVALDCNDGSNIRITTGWWTGAYGGAEHNCIDMVQEDENGNKFIELDIKGDGNLYDNIDVQHLLFTGDGYTVLEIYVEEWVDGAGAAKPVVFWENESGDAIPGWGGKFRFGLDGNDGGNECIATFDADTWAVIKDGKFYAQVDCNDGSNIRITTGWWTGAYGGNEHNCLDMVQEDENGNKVIELDIKGEGSLYDNIDVQHLLFTGDGYTLLKLYYIP